VGGWKLSREDELKADLGFTASAFGDEFGH